MSKRPRFFVKMSVTELKAYSIKYVVGNGRSAFWAMTANLLYLALTWESNHIISFLTAWIGFMPSSFCNYINSSTWSGSMAKHSLLPQSNRNGWVIHAGKVIDFRSVYLPLSSWDSLVRCSAMILRASSEGSHCPRCGNWQVLRLAICERRKVNFVMKAQVLVLQSIKFFCAP